MDRTQAEAIYDAGRETVVETLLGMDRELHESARAVSSLAPDPTVHRPQLPGPHQGVTLLLPSGDHIPAQVKERFADALTLVVMIPVAPFAERDLAGMVLEFALPDGRLHLRGAFTCPDQQVPEVLHLAQPRLADIVQQRQFFRVSAARPAHLLLGAQNAEPIPCTTVNLGVGGGLLDGPHWLAVGSELRFEIAIVPGESPVRGSGRVQRKDGQGRPVIVFDSLEQTDRERLAHFVSDRRLDEGFGPG